MYKMNLLVYINGLNGAGKRLQRVLETEVSKDQIEICRDVAGLTRRFRGPRLELKIAVLLVSSREDLEAILSIAELLYDLRIILILPDREHETISMGFKLYPRFVSYADGDFSDVAAVLGKMLKL
jgi:hypothetical protein